MKALKRSGKAVLRFIAVFQCDIHSVKLDKAVARYVDACDDAADYLKLLDERRKEIEATIDAVQSEHLQTLLREIYINGKKIVRVAADRDQSYEHICRLHGAALLAVCEVLRKE